MAHKKPKMNKHVFVIISEIIFITKLGVNFIIKCNDSANIESVLTISLVTS